MADDHHDDDLLDERLDRMEHRIQALDAELSVREQGGRGPHYYQSGRVHPELDDQTITPP